MTAPAKKARPYMPMYWGDYIRKTAHLSTLEHGAYLLLIAHYWNTGEALPDNDDVLRRITRTTTKQFKELKPIIHSFFAKVGDKLVHERVEEELQTARGVSTLQSSRAKQRWENHKNQQGYLYRGNAGGDALHLHHHTEYNTPSSPSIPGAGEGVLKNGVSEGVKGRPWSVEPFLSDTDRAHARANAPEWDLHVLIRTYDEGVPTRGIPDKPGKAFVAWCLKYTKGKPPGYGA